ncbi:hypothetical protein D7030_02870 [Flavobacteriaceae bacterium AU392]|nr:hypothetical protein D1817_09345 [Flavobacteriaceae bacterium]RKM85630.1 hypothetical protein D7030_02870 [Flavobacteriaceae bacterium AU392]
MTTKQGLLFFHSIFIVVYLIFLISRYFIRLYKKKGIKIAFKYFLLRLILPVFIIVISIKLIIHNNTQEDFNFIWDHSVENTKEYSNNLYKTDGKHRGMSVYRLGRNNNSQINNLLKTNIEWISLFPYFYQKDEQSKTVNVPDEVGKWTDRDSIFMNDIKALQDKGIHIMLKPHLWMSDGWRSNIKMNSKAEWDTWFESYKKNILHYARMAEATNVELLCIGTELRSSVENQPNQWRVLIKEIKKIYNGKLTYAANWDGEFNNIDFWDELDYIGVQAYFPLTLTKNPDLETIKKGWDKHIKVLEDISITYNTPVLFTEVGYRNDAYATVEPWVWGSIFTRLYTKKSDKTQQLAYQALFEKLWNKKWFAGTYAWQWSSGDFPIRSKPAQNTIAKWYGKE